ncbi:hypothetical protein V8E36_003367 [Tilletia maclaganii]
MRFTLSIAAALGLASIVAAIDSRRLVEFTDQSPATFAKKWETACKACKPKDTSLTYAGYLVEKGNFKGQHVRTQARVFCSFVKKSDPSGPRTTVTKHIAAEVGAKLVNSA